MFSGIHTRQRYARALRANVTLRWQWKHGGIFQLAYSHTVRANTVATVKKPHLIFLSRVSSSPFDASRIVTSPVAKDAHGLVRLLEMLDLLSRQLYVDRRVCVRNHEQSTVAPGRNRKRRRLALGHRTAYGTVLTDQFFQFVKGRGADYGRSDD